MTLRELITEAERAFILEATSQLELARKYWQDVPGEARERCFRVASAIARGYLVRGWSTAEVAKLLGVDRRRVSDMRAADPIVIPIRLSWHPRHPRSGRWITAYPSTIERPHASLTIWWRDPRGSAQIERSTEIVNCKRHPYGARHGGER